MALKRDVELILTAYAVRLAKKVDVLICSTAD